MKDVGGLNVWALPSQPNAAIELALRQLSERSGRDSGIAGAVARELGSDPEHLCDSLEIGGRLQCALFEPTRAGDGSGNQDQRRELSYQEFIRDGRGFEGAAGDGGSGGNGIPGQPGVAVGQSGQAGGPSAICDGILWRARPQNLNRAGDVSHAVAVWQRQDGIRNDAWQVAQWALALGYLLAVIDLKFLNWI